MNTFFLKYSNKNILTVLAIYFGMVLMLNAQLSENCISKDENQLYELIMAYRKEKRLTSIPLSSSLTIVARTHARDLMENRPDQGNCNKHSWSDKGSWTPCCYTTDHKQAECMWNKPKELTSYKGYGFEISCGGSYNLTPSDALECWKESKPHNEVIINAGDWKKEWNAIGIGIYGHYAVVWFGWEKDEAGEPNLCKE